MVSSNKSKTKVKQKSADIMKHVLKSNRLGLRSKKIKKSARALGGIYRRFLIA